MRSIATTVDDLNVELVLHVTIHIKDQLKVVIQKMLCVEEILLNSHNYFLMMSCCCIKFSQWSLFHGQLVGYLCGSWDVPCCPLFQPAGGDFFLHTILTPVWDE
jgi:hypothetical protein